MSKSGEKSWNQLNHERQAAHELILDIEAVLRDNAKDGPEDEWIQYLLDRVLQYRHGVYSEMESILRGNDHALPR